MLNTIFFEKKELAKGTRITALSATIKTSKQYFNNKYNDKKAAKNNKINKDNKRNKTKTNNNKNRKPQQLQKQQ